MSREVIKASGMSCQHCAMRVTKGLKELAGVREVEVDLSSGSITVDFDPAEVNRDKMEEAVKKAGYEVVG